MKRKIFSYFEIAAATAVSKSDRRAFVLGAIGIRRDGAMVKALNSPTEAPNRQVHAEKRLCSKLDHGAEVYVCRIRLDTLNFGMARPCDACMKALIHRNVKKIYYTITPNEFGIIDLENLSERELIV